MAATTTAELIESALKEADTIRGQLANLACYVVELHDVEIGSEDGFDLWRVVFRGDSYESAIERILERKRSRNQ